MGTRFERGKGDSQKCGAAQGRAMFFQRHDIVLTQKFVMKFCFLDA
jgi:hypothetical protein